MFNNSLPIKAVSFLLDGVDILLRSNIAIRFQMFPKPYTLTRNPSITFVVGGLFYFSTNIEIDGNIHTSFIKESCEFMKGITKDELQLDDFQNNFDINIYKDLNNVLSSVSPSVKALVESEMTKQLISKVLRVHTQKISQRKDGRWRTTIWDEKKKVQTSVYSKGDDINTLYVKLYEHYFDYGNTFKDMFYEMCDYTLSITPPDRLLARNKTVREWKQDFVRFYEKSKTGIANKKLKDITLSDLCLFLDEAHSQGINKQRHSSIKTLYTKTLKFCARNKGEAILDLFTMIDYNNQLEYPYKEVKEHSFYDENERAKVLIYLDSLVNPTLNQLLIAVIFELSLRIGEAIGLRYDDFVFEVNDNNEIISGKVYIRGKLTNICSKNVDRKFYL